MLNMVIDAFATGDDAAALMFGEDGSVDEDGFQQHCLKVGVQFGLTKVFFRRSAYESVEAQRTIKLSEAAIKTQANIRRWLQLRAFRRLKFGCVMIQCAVRCALARRRRTFLKEARAATGVQSRWRCYNSTSRFVTMRRGTVAFQSHFRAVLARKRAKNIKLGYSVIVIQRALRRHTARSWFMLARHSCVLIQTMKRGRVARDERRKRFREMRDVKGLADTVGNLKSQLAEQQRSMKEEKQRLREEMRLEMAAEMEKEKAKLAEKAEEQAQQRAEETAAAAESMTLEEELAKLRQANNDEIGGELQLQQANETNRMIAPIMAQAFMQQGSLEQALRKQTAEADEMRRQLDAQASKERRMGMELEKLRREQRLRDAGEEQKLVGDALEHERRVHDSAKQVENDEGFVVSEELAKSQKVLAERLQERGQVRQSLQAQVEKQAKDRVAVQSELVVCTERARSGALLQEQLRLARDALQQLEQEQERLIEREAEGFALQQQLQEQLQQSAVQRQQLEDELAIMRSDGGDEEEQIQLEDKLQVIRQTEATSEALQEQLDREGEEKTETAAEIAALKQSVLTHDDLWSRKEQAGGGLRPVLLQLLEQEQEAAAGERVMLLAGGGVPVHEHRCNALEATRALLEREEEQQALLETELELLREKERVAISLQEQLDAQAEERHMLQTNLERLQQKQEQQSTAKSKEGIQELQSELQRLKQREEQTFVLEAKLADQDSERKALEQEMARLREGQDHSAAASLQEQLSRQTEEARKYQQELLVLKEQQDADSEKDELREKLAALERETKELRTQAKGRSNGVNGADNGALSPTSAQGQSDQLHAMATSGADLELERLLGEGADVHALNRDGRTPLHSAALAGKLSAIQILLEKGAVPNRQDTLGHTPLHLTGCPDCLRLLLDFGSNPNIPDHSGVLALHQAAASVRARVIPLLCFTPCAY
jgi:hypothetical protein